MTTAPRYRAPHPGVQHQAEPTAHPQRVATEPRALAFVRRHPLATFLLWFFAIGQAFAFVPVVAAAHGWQLPRQPFIVLSTVVGLLLPTLAITRVVDGPEAYRRLVAAIRPSRESVGWYALAVVAVPAASVVITLALAGAPGPSSAGFGSAIVGGLLVQLLVVFVTTNLWEEVAWTGFVHVRLQRRHRATTAAVFAGLLFALQHVSLVAGAPAADAVSLLVLLAVLSIPFRFLVVWVHARTGSLFLVGLLHASGNAVSGGSGFAAGMLPRLYPGSELSTMAHLLAFAVLGLVVLVATRGRLGLAPRSRR